jgi:Fe2+ transport system protein FeoA
MNSQLSPLSSVPKNVPVIIKDYSKGMKDHGDTLNRILEFGFLPGTKIKVTDKFNGIHRVALESSTSEYAVDKFIARNLFIEPVDKEALNQKKPKKNILRKVIDFLSFDFS